MNNLAIILISLFFSFYSYGYTIQDLIKALDQKDINKAYKLEKQLPFKDKLNLLTIFLLEKDLKKEAENVINFKRKKYISNIIFAEDFSNIVIIDKKEKKLYLIKTISNVPVPILKINISFNKEPDNNLYFPIAYLTKTNPIFKSSGFLILKKRDIWLFSTDKQEKICQENKTCIFISNNDFRNLTDFIKIKKTPILIEDSLETVENKKDIETKQASILNFIYLWKKAWENTPQDIQKYFSFYSPNFTYEKGDFKAWKSYKETITKNKKWIKIKISDIKIFKLGNIYIASFFMEYNSNNYDFIGTKIIYIKQENNSYKIIREEVL